MPAVRYPDSHQVAKGASLCRKRWRWRRNSLIPFALLPQDAAVMAMLEEHADQGQQGTS
jgi:hypothetical protein